MNTVQARKRRKEGGATKGNSDHQKKKRRYIIHKIVGTGQANHTDN